jgi:hypothetical protein
MTTTIIVALVAGSASIVGAGLTFLASIWMGGRKALTDEARLGLDALKEGIIHARQQCDKLNDQQGKLQKDLTVMSVRVHLVLGENNWFRVLCGEEPQSSLEDFATLRPEARRRVEQLFAPK